MEMAFGLDSPARLVSLLLVLVAVPLLVVLFLAMTRSALTDGGPVEKPNRVRQWYGYTICLVAVVTALICTASLLGNVFDLSNPLGSESYGTSLRSFEAYQATRDRDPIAPSHDTTSQPDTVSPATLRARFEALRADRIATRRFEATKGLVTDAVLLVIAIALFAGHWRWLRRTAAETGETPA
ncbi:MAG TPA: hypothetical protein VFK13_13415 [Gemmatimonadaceae bacterium]|nr:hypothetical protein [Gemmatimonadaceae bacterium]